MTSPRLVSLDAFRGATIAAMILVNNPGSWSAIYWPLDHAKWHGWTPTDLIFPFFLFMVGMGIVFSSRGSFTEAALRAGKLVGLGLFMAAWPYFNFATLRWPGVLQRIGLCYLAAWVLRRALGPRGLAVTVFALLAGYWVLLTFVPLPGGAAPNLEPGQNLAAAIDRLFLDGHMWRQTKTWDPEGLVSTLPAIATTLLGVLAGLWLRAGHDKARTALGLLAAGAALTLLGDAWGAAFPVNKSLWTSSYVLLSGGLAAGLFGLFYALADGLEWRAHWTPPLVAWGRNAILVFVLSGLLAKTLALVKVAAADGSLVALSTLLHRALFLSWLPPYPASLAYALANVAGWHLVLVALDRRGWYFKV